MEKTGYTVYRIGSKCLYGTVWDYDDEGENLGSIRCDLDTVRAVCKLIERHKFMLHKCGAKLRWYGFKPSQHIKM